MRGLSLRQGRRTLLDADATGRIEALARRIARHALRPARQSLAAIFGGRVRIGPRANPRRSHAKTSCRHVAKSRPSSRDRNSARRMGNLQGRAQTRRRSGDQCTMAGCSAMSAIYRNWPRSRSASGDVLLVPGAWWAYPESLSNVMKTGIRARRLERRDAARYDPFPASGFVQPRRAQDRGLVREDRLAWRRGDVRHQKRRA